MQAMLEQDYFMRMITQITHYIARMIRLRQSEQQKQAFLLLGQGYEHFFGLSIPMLETMDATDLMNWLRDNGRDYPEVVRGLLDFLNLHIDLLDDDDEIGMWRLKRLDVLLHLAVEENRAEFRKIPEAADWLGLDVRKFYLPSSFYPRLISLHENEGQLATAEDLLHLWLESAQHERSEPALQEVWLYGLQWYESLLTRSDEWLANGELPRAEVEQGLASWQRIPAFMSQE
jgi:hypothetical protein